MRIRKIIVICCVIIILLGLSTVLYVKFYPYAYAESENSYWKAYFISTQRYGFSLESGFCDGVLVYEGNKDGIAENVTITMKVDGKSYWNSEPVAYESRKVSGNAEGYLIYTVLLKKDKIYWFSEDIEFGNVDLIELDIAWEEDGKPQTDSLSIDVKEAREHSVPLVQI